MDAFGASTINASTGTFLYLVKSREYAQTSSCSCRVWAAYYRNSNQHAIHRSGAQTSCAAAPRLGRRHTDWAVPVRTVQPVQSKPATRQSGHCEQANAAKQQPYGSQPETM